MEMGIERAKRIIKADERTFAISWVAVGLGLMGTALLWDRPDAITTDDYGIIKLMAYGDLTIGWILMEKALFKRHFIILPALAALIFFFVEHDLMLLCGKIMGVLLGAFVAHMKLLPNTPSDQLVDEAKMVIATKSHSGHIDPNMWR